MKNVFLIFHTRHTSMDYSHTAKAINRLGDAYELAESMWIVRTERELPFVEDYMSLQAGAVDLLLITKLERGNWRMNHFAADKKAHAVLTEWLA